jgi:CheY-like chemotaxis protein
MKTRSSLHVPGGGNARAASSPQPSPPMEERENTLGFVVQGIQRAKSHSVNSHPVVRRRGPLLLLSEDEVLCWRLLVAASKAGRRLVRGHPAADARQTLRIVKPELVLLDLDLPDEAAWEAADALLQDEDCPPVMLLTSRGKQSDFDTAVEAGCLIEKNASPTKVMELVELRLRSIGTDRQEQKAIQRLVIRWLKPCSWSAQGTLQNRYWVINE